MFQKEEMPVKNYYSKNLSKMPIYLGVGFKTMQGWILSIQQSFRI